MEKLIEILTSDDKDIIKQAIIELILDRAKSDLDTWDKYVLYPPDVEEIVTDAIIEAKSEFEKFVTDYYLEKMKSDFIKMKEGRNEG